MKRIKTVNGYAIYQAATQRDADNYNCKVGNYNVYIAQDIRDFGLTNSYPEYEDIETLTEVLNICNASQFAIACALADELSSSTIQDMDLTMEIERRLDSGEAVNTIRRCYDRENDRLYASIEEAIRDGFDPYAEIEFDPYEDHPAMARDEDGKLHVIEDDCEWDDDAIDGDLEDVLEAAMADDELALVDYEVSGIEVGDYLLDGDQAIVRVAGITRPAGSSFPSFEVEYPNGTRATLGALHVNRCTVVNELSDPALQQEAGARWAALAPAPFDLPTTRSSHASYAVLQDPDDGQYYTIAAPSSAGLDTQERRDDWLLLTVAKHIAFSDCGGYDVIEVVVDGRRVEYSGWQPGMLIEFVDCETGEFVWDCCRPDWDH